MSGVTRHVGFAIHRKRIGNAVLPLAHARADTSSMCSSRVGRIGIHAERAGAFEFVFAIAAGQQSDAERARALRGDHVPDAVAEHERLADVHAKTFGGGEEQIGIGLGVFDLIARHHRHLSGSTPSDARLCPAVSMRPDVAIAHGILFAVRCSSSSRAPGSGFTLLDSRLYSAACSLAQAIEAFRRRVESGFAQQDVGEQSAAHADLAMDAPHRQRNAFLIERIFPREHVLIDAVDQRAVEIEQEGGAVARHGGLRCDRNEFTARCVSSRRRFSRPRFRWRG